MFSSAQGRLTPRALNKTEIGLLKQHNVCGLFDSLIDRLKEPGGYRLVSRVTLGGDYGHLFLGAIDDAELGGMGCNMSLIAPGIAIPVHYFKDSGQNPEQPLRAWTSSNLSKSSNPAVSQALRDFLSKSVRENTANALPSYFAFPRFLVYRTITRPQSVNRKWHMEQSRTSEAMDTLQSADNKEPYSVSWPIVGKGTVAVWRQLTLKSHTGSEDPFCDGGNPLLQIERGMPPSPRITYWRLDITRAGKSIFSVLLRVVIVKDQESEIDGPWNLRDQITFPPLSAVLSDEALAGLKSKNDDSAVGAVGRSRAKSQGRRRSASPLKTEATKYRRRSRSRSRTPPPSHALSHRQQVNYGRRFAAGF